MSKDKRIWIKLAVQMPETPKIAILSDAAFRAYVEALCYCRDLRTDGFIPGRVAMQRWGAEVLDELMSNDPDAPSLIEVDRGFQIHDYAAHQETRAEIEEREMRLKKMSAAGVEARQRNRERNLAGNHQGNRAGTPQGLPESESESESDNYSPISVSQVSNAREKPTDINETSEQVDSARALAATRKLDLDKIRSLASAECGRQIGFGESLRLGTLILERATGHVRSPMAYIASAFKNPVEVQAVIDREVVL